MTTTTAKAAALTHTPTTVMEAIPTITVMVTPAPTGTIVEVVTMDIPVTHTETEGVMVDILEVKMATTHMGMAETHTVEDMVATGMGDTVDIVGTMEATMHQRCRLILVQVQAHQQTLQQVLKQLVQLS